MGRPRVEAAHENGAQQMNLIVAAVFLLHAPPRFISMQEEGLIVL